MLKVWLQFKRWLRRLALDLSTGVPIAWGEKIDQLVSIANEWLDRKHPPEKPPERRMVAPRRLRRHVPRRKKA